MELGQQLRDPPDCFQMIAQITALCRRSGAIRKDMAAPREIGPSRAQQDES
jgi:hypothetical protein